MSEIISIAIIIPFIYNKKDDLNIIIHNINKIKISKFFKYHIYFIGQNNFDRFNLGLLCNIGFFISNTYKYNKYVFLDQNYIFDTNTFNDLFIINKHINENMCFTINSTLFISMGGFVNSDFTNKLFYEKIKKFDLSKNGIKDLTKYYIKINGTLLKNYVQIVQPKNKKEFFYEIDFLAFHSKETDYLFFNDYVDNYILNYKKKNETFLQHNIHKHFISCIEPLVTWNEIKEKILDTYTIPKKYVLPFKNLNFHQFQIKKLLDDEFFNNNFSSISFENLKDTLKLIHSNLNEIIYIRIRNNKIECSYHIYSNINEIDWYSDLKYNDKNLDDSIIDILQDKKKEYYTPKNPHFSPVTGNLIKLENCSNFRTYQSSYIKEFLEMINQTIIKYKIIPDSDLLINRKDFSYFKKDYQYGYDNLKTFTYDKNIKLYPICCQSKTQNNIEILIPSADEWNYIKTSKKLNTNWSEKINKCCFRGKSTGCAPDYLNKRILMSEYSFQNNNFLDIGITEFTNKLKVYKQNIYFNNIEKYSHLLKPFLSQEEQSNYKYILNIEGNAQSYRFPSEFKKKSLVINLKSDFFMWFEKLLINHKHYIQLDNINDINDIINITDCKAQKIAENGYKFSKIYGSKKYILNYWFFLLIKLNNMNF